MASEITSKEIVKLIEILKKQDLKSTHISQIFDIFLNFYVPTKILSKILGIHIRRVSQLVDDGIIDKKAPGMYDLVESISKFVNYQKGLIEKKFGLEGKDRKRIERYKADVLELQLMEMEGKLVKKDDIKRDAFLIARKVRESLLNIPPRISTLLAAENNHIKVFEILEGEIESALSELSDERIRKKFSGRIKTRSDGNGQRMGRGTQELITEGERRTGKVEDEQNPVFTGNNGLSESSESY